jgi:hypothetical protein
MIVTFPDNTEEIIDSIRGAIGRDVEFVTSTFTECYVCEQDPITGTSLDSFCIYCSGLYFIPVYSSYSVSGHITWGNAEQLNWVTGGQYFDGDARVQIKYTSEALTVLDQLDHVVIDNKTFKEKSRIYRGVPELNRILIDLVEEE